MLHENLRIGTCSWNYACWVGLVYSQKYRTAAEYLSEYAKKYRTVEIDSCFYRIPFEKEIQAYKNAVDDNFMFTIKAPRDLTLTHLRENDKGATLRQNEKFLSAEYFNVFMDRLKQLSGNISAIMLEFEYLRKEKMPSLDIFLRKLEKFVQEIPRGIPIAIEPRNSNYLHEEYFSFLKDNNITHVFSEKQYMPPVTSVFEKYCRYLNNTVIIRLLGGNRALIEEKTKGNWNCIIDEKSEKASIVEMIKQALSQGKKVTLNVNNHYEGCAPLTIERIVASLR
ncbi:MAG: DUF72 domain-containing protein [Fibrobacter sp.]|nr:DUF72 domain-containing protein [Fibrobacter sp.]